MLKQVAFSVIFSTFLSLGSALECYDYGGDVKSSPGASDKDTCPVTSGLVYECMTLTIDDGPAEFKGQTLRACVSKNNPENNAAQTTALKAMPSNGCIQKEPSDGGLLHADLGGTDIIITACLCNKEDLCNGSLEELIKKADEAEAEAEKAGAGALFMTINALILCFIAIVIL